MKTVIQRQALGQATPHYSLRSPFSGVNVGCGALACQLLSLTAITIRRVPSQCPER